MAARHRSEWDGWCTSQLKIVLLGGRNSGKSSLGNLLLGKEEFVTKETTSCSRRLGLVAGQRLTVVDTPGWWCDFSVQETPELVKSEILSSVSLCSPGPQVFLITVKVSSAFSEKRRRAVEEHVSLLGEKVWSHSMVVFTSADRSKHTVAEEHIRAGGATLRWLSEKCSQRCHSVVLGEDSEVSQLMEKIQKLVTGNGNRVFVLQENILRATAAKKKAAEERAQQRFLRVKKHRSLMRGIFGPLLISGLCCWEQRFWEDFSTEHNLKQRDKPTTEENDPMSGGNRSGVRETGDGGGHAWLVDELLP
ncbi:hypothetical protein Q5P01_016990 [Channa striata]|uniref:AIG1-type G domain-containing protein n=1 Tax=Channa striata TaxID=64152 RepID=A0AA88MAF4_CHASR|nr:hypothetical protein Q5P01_016990 [Channa striata]